MRTFISLALGGLLVANASAASEDAIAPLYRRAVNGDARATEECVALLDRVVKEQPANQLARVYLGSAYTLRSRDMNFGTQKLATLKQGLAVMDAAVAAAPDDVHVRLVRALTSDALPFFLGRKKQARDDFAALAQEAKRAPGNFSSDELATIQQHSR